MNPLVSCLCLTFNGRKEWLEKSIACFQAQTYENLEWILVPEDNYRTIGDKRNAGCEIASGEIICHWDDDDFSFPGRVAAQVKTLQDSGKAVTGYHSMKFTDGVSWWQYRGGHGSALGTSLCYRRDWWERHRFASMQTAEDNVFVTMALRERQLVVEPDIDLMYATIHPGNTCKRVIRPYTHNWVPLKDFQMRTA